MLLTEIANHKRLAPLIWAGIEYRTLAMDTWQRGQIKQALTKIGYPVEDLVGYVAGVPP